MLCTLMHLSMTAVCRSEKKYILRKSTHVHMFGNFPRDDQFSLNPRKAPWHHRCSPLHSPTLTAAPSTGPEEPMALRHRSDMTWNTILCRKSSLSVALQAKSKVFEKQFISGLSSEARGTYIDIAEGLQLWSPLKDARRQEISESRPAKLCYKL